MASLPKTFKAAVTVKANETVLQELELKPPGPGYVLVKVLACGFCHTDLFIIAGALGNLFPRITGHEIVGDVAAVGEGVTGFAPGDRVGGAWHGGHDGTCSACTSGQPHFCDNSKINGVSFDGGLAEYVHLRYEAVVRVPKDMDPAQAAPLLCAGLTTFNGMRKQKIEHGSVVAVQGLGGLGHLAVQYANKMGYRTVAISSGSGKEKFARQLGAHDYIDTGSEDMAARLKAMGGASMIVSTAPNPKAISGLIRGLRFGGTLLVLPPIGPVEFDTTAMVTKGISVVGSLTGSVIDAEETIAFSQRHGVECMVETYPLSEIHKAMDSCSTGAARFRAVVTM
ncbi:alcohol dehydrogenase [Xylaria nigripes]|nr:alcohol dehydrogenase [Xylaria nigripes]